MKVITTVLVVSLILTVIVLILSLITISKGYGYKHTIDPLVKDDQNANHSEESPDQNN